MKVENAVIFMDRFKHTKRDIPFSVPPYSLFWDVDAIRKIHFFYSTFGVNQIEKVVNIDCFNKIPKEVFTMFTKFFSLLGNGNK